MMMKLPEGLSLRPAARDDAEACAALFNACAVQEGGAPDTETEELAREWDSPSFNLETDARVVVTPAGWVVAYAEVWAGAPYVRHQGWGRVHPDYQGQGIGVALLAWAESRSWEAAAQAPEGAAVTLQQFSISTNTCAQVLFEQAGYAVVRHFLRMVIEMDAPPPGPVVPAGIVLRPFVRGSEERAVIQAMRDSFRDHWGHVERPFEDQFAEWMHWIDTDPDFDPALWWVALDGEQIAGIALCSPKITEDPEMGWVNTLGVLRPWRRQGLALALLQHAFGEFYRRGTRKVGLGVDAQSLTGATRLYERAGMRATRRYVTYQKTLHPGVDLSTQALDV